MINFERSQSLQKNVSTVIQKLDIKSKENTGALQKEFDEKLIRKWRNKIKR